MVQTHPMPDTVASPESQTIQDWGRAFHRSRNLIMSMRGYAELIQCSESRGERHGEWAEKIVSQLDRLNDLHCVAERLLVDVSPRTELLPVALLLRSADRLVRQRAHGSFRIPARFDLRDEAWVRGHGPDLIEALAAVLENAFEASPDDAQVEVSLDGVGRSWRVTISDQGSGFEPGTEARVGEAFFSRKAGHAGLGLFLGHTLLRRHGCELEFTSNPNGGTHAVISSNGDLSGGNQ